MRFPAALMVLVPVFAFCLTGTLTPSSTSIGHYGILELSFRNPGAYANPWEDLALEALFVSPSGDTFKVGGFYCDADEWKFRFSPVETGQWRYSATVAYSTDIFSDSGSFQCVAGMRKGFIKISPDNPRRFAFPDNTPYYPAGLQMCWGVNLMANLDTVPVGGQIPAIPIHDFVDTFAAASYNFFRLSMHNCAITVEETLTVTGNRYLVPESKAYDSLLTYLHGAGFRIVLNPCFDCIIYSDQWQDSAQKAAVLRNVDYLVDRYSAFVDIIEINNEPYGTDALPLDWFSDIIGRIRLRDPYRHLIGQELPPTQIRDSSYVQLIDVLMPHYYYDGTATNQDVLTSGMITGNRTLVEKFKTMPVLYGEQGYNAAKTFFPDSPKWQRMRHWTAFFTEGALTSWYMYPYSR